MDRLLGSGAEHAPLPPPEQEQGGSRQQQGGSRKGSPAAAAQSQQAAQLQQSQHAVQQQAQQPRPEPFLAAADWWVALPAAGAGTSARSACSTCAHKRPAAPMHRWRAADMLPLRRWVEHLAVQPDAEAGAPGAGATQGELKVLQWVYGKVGACACARKCVPGADSAAGAGPGRARRHRLLRPPGSCCRASCRHLSTAAYTARALPAHRPAPTPAPTPAPPPPRPQVVHAQMEQLAARQAEVRAGRESREGAMLDYLEDMAFAWRQLQSYTDKRAKLELMRKQVGGRAGWWWGRWWCGW